VGDVLLARVESYAEETGDPGRLGFDIAVEFTPAWKYSGPRGQPPRWRRRATRVLGPHYLDMDNVYEYSNLIAGSLAAPDPPYERLRCVTPCWDNSARRASDAMIYAGSTPELYRGWLSEILRREAPKQAGRPVFVNAWNEWAEGNHLEPDQRWGRAYLEATREALQAAPGPIR
jgi:hypothetical protein